MVRVLLEDTPIDEARGASIASAITTDIGDSSGNFIHITGTTTITSFGSVSAGTERVLVFDDVLTLTHNSISLILPGEEDITTQAGDAAFMRSEGSGNWRCVSYLRSNGEPVLSAGHGQCRMELDGSDVKLIPYNGNMLIIDGISQKVPSGGVSLAATSLTADTTYFIYAYMSGTAMTLEASTTGHATDSSNGVEIKSGDSTRTLVGMARPITGPAWVDSVTQRFVVSWFNRGDLKGNKSIGTPTTSSKTGEELESSSDPDDKGRIELLTWGDNAIPISLFGDLTNDIVGQWSVAAIAPNGIMTGANQVVTTTVSGQRSAFSTQLSTELSEGYHYVTMFGVVSSMSSTATYNNIDMYLTISG